MWFGCACAECKVVCSFNANRLESISISQNSDIETKKREELIRNWPKQTPVMSHWTLIWNAILFFFVLIARRIPQRTDKICVWIWLSGCRWQWQKCKWISEKKGENTKTKENNCQYKNSIAAIVSQIGFSVHNFSKSKKKKKTESKLKMKQYSGLECHSWDFTRAFFHSVDFFLLLLLFFISNKRNYFQQISTTPINARNVTRQKRNNAWCFYKLLAIESVWNWF